MKFILISPKNKTAYNFRGDLLREIISMGYEVIVTGPNNDEAARVRELGVRFVLIPLNKTGLNAVADMRYICALRALFRKEKPDITLGYTIKPAIYGAVAARLAGVKNINSMITGAGYIFAANTLKAKIIKLAAGVLYKTGLKCADTVIFQNQDDLNEFVARNLVNRGKCRIVNGSGVNMEKFKPAALPDKMTFLMVSRLMYTKGVGEYLQAAKKVKARYPDVRFMLLGSMENIHDSLTMKELAPYLEVVDYYGETNDVVSYYKQCSVYVLPSYREGISRTVLEAMAMGRPVITTDAPGCREPVTDGVNGFLVPVRDSAAVAAKMEWFIEHRQEIEKMGNAGSRICRERFDVKKVNRTMMNYLGILADGDFHDKRQR